MLEITIEPNSINIKEFSQNFLDILKIHIQNLLIDFECKDRFCSLLICDNNFITILNKQYRNKDYATDVLSFAFDDEDEFIIPSSSLGEIIISSEKALQQAIEFEISYEEEFARLTIHGVLHLLGYDHELGEEEHQEMFAIQDEYMQKFMQDYNNTNSALI